MLPPDYTHHITLHGSPHIHALVQTRPAFTVAVLRVGEAVSPVPDVSFSSYRELCFLLFPHLKYIRTVQEMKAHLSSPGLSLQDSLSSWTTLRTTGKTFFFPTLQTLILQHWGLKSQQWYNVEGRATGRCRGSTGLRYSRDFTAQITRLERRERCRLTDAWFV